MVFPRTGFYYLHHLGQEHYLNERGPDYLDSTLLIGIAQTLLLEKKKWKYVFSSSLSSLLWKNVRLSSDFKQSAEGKSFRDKCYKNPKSH